MTEMKIRSPLPLLPIIRLLSLVSKIWGFFRPLPHIIVESEVSTETRKCCHNTNHKKKEDNFCFRNWKKCIL